MWRTGRRAPLALGLLSTLVVLLAAPVWGQQDNNMDFEQVIGGEPPPALRPYQARDGTPLHYRRYTSARQTNNVIVMLHGSGYHSAYLQPLAAALFHRCITTI